MFDQLDDLLRLVDARLAALRAAQSEPYKAFASDYARRAADYALTIQTNIGRLLR